MFKFFESAWVLILIMALLASLLLEHTLLYRYAILAVALILLAVTATVRAFVHEEFSALNNQIINHTLMDSATSQIDFGGNSTTSAQRLEQALQWSLEWQKRNKKALQNSLDGMLKAMGKGVIIINNEAAVTLVNQLAIHIVEQPIKCGDSIFNFFWRQALSHCLEAGSSSDSLLKTIKGKALNAKIVPLQEDSGFVILLEVDIVRSAQLGEQLIDDSIKQVTEADSAQADTLIEQLPIVVIDTETTGLNPYKDAIIAFAGVHCTGVERTGSKRLERFILPDAKLNAQSIRVHGILPTQLQDKPPLSALWQELSAFLGQRLIVGHHIGFDLQVLAHNLIRQNITWHVPTYFIDTQLLAASLYPKLAHSSLEHLVDFFAISDVGRHTALGDALMTSTVVSRLLVEAIKQGDKTLSDLLKRQSQQSTLIKKQKKNGWIAPELLS